ncbi:dynein light chain roadblock protein [Aureococcus anophagefferens]|uniref:Dynein light chain roadblock protein n=2 Tax=Aureococcus anophagefferens TaxID=44056 RepID=A0ABR1G3F9_AURAN|nr:hypothetical protein AURANDRAFT_24395 [Aureococcus anophagefferens]EGB09905.1 hypothetical protein AURANDRAFT_24395 [Aureococcus anophagefferens]KAH8059092.1 dynein intermediate chain binding protein [Aureococcus anophagefferens]KAH8072936.1 dynein intermediate chain binding protein [Aureococcus anophagefferens]|mmetsp:Transcript_35046/g.118707  ORF Transcript_35046/g.118707 Transcript_35046/m.118707 type:complete len:98 (+) Transcript_35046:103-396(+)|eukprot:XP_009035931.1 hypothetical protein AURANDRAFT_24395 [Aureococcus anophagefferens]
MSSEVEETLRRIQSHRGVKGVLIVSAQGVPIRSNLENEETNTYAALLSQLAMKASSVVRTLDETDELTFFRIRSKKHEIMIAPDAEYLLIVIQETAS